VAGSHASTSHADDGGEEGERRGRAHARHHHRPAPIVREQAGDRRRDGGEDQRGAVAAGVGAEDGLGVVEVSRRGGE
jgi:hypothetical protein